MIRSPAVTDTQLPPPVEAQLPSTIDLDAIFASRLEAKAEQAGETVGTIKLFGRVWNLVEPNVVTTLKSLRLDENPSGILDLIKASFVEGEGDEFIAEMEKIAGLDGEFLGEIYSKIVEVTASGRPTKPSSKSRRGRSTGRSGRS